MEEASKGVVDRGDVLDSTHSLFFRRCKMRMVRLAFVAALASGISGLLMWARSGAVSPNDEAQGKVWWAHVQKLSDP